MARVAPLPLAAALIYTLVAAALAPVITLQRHPEPQTTSHAAPLPTSTPAPATPVPRPTPEPSVPRRSVPPLPRGAFDFAEVFRHKCSVLLEHVPALAQERNLSCESATIRMVLAAQGLVVREEEILARMNLDPNPHKGFRGNVDGPLLQEDMVDYGTYAEVVARVLESFGADARVVYGMSDDELRAAIEHRRPVIVWMTRQPEPKVIDAGDYRLVLGQHVQVVVGLTTDGRFVVHDPWGARPDSGREGTSITPQIQNWDLFDRMAVVVRLDR